MLLMHSTHICTCTNTLCDYARMASAVGRQGVRGGGRYEAESACSRQEGGGLHDRSDILLLFLLPCC